MLSILDLLGGLIAIIVLVSQIPKLKDYDLNASDLNAVKGVMVFFIFFIVVAMCFNSLNIFLVTKNLKSKEAKYLSGLPVL